jgi:hypothetical protein
MENYIKVCYADAIMKRGRPMYSEVRQNMVEIVATLKRAYGYEIYTFYKRIFPPVTLRLMYYHLRKGVSIGEFKVHKVKVEKGDYSWGGAAEKIYYSLGPNAQPRGEARVAKLVKSQLAKKAK